MTQPYGSPAETPNVPPQPQYQPAPPQGPYQVAIPQPYAPQPYAPQPYAAGQYPQQAAAFGQPNGMATAGGVIGIGGAVFSLIPVLGIVIGLITGVLAIIFSSVGLSRAGSTGSGKGLAIAGLVLGVLTVIFKLIPGVNLL